MSRWGDRFKDRQDRGCRGSACNQPKELTCCGTMLVFVLVFLVVCLMIAALYMHSPHLSSSKAEAEFVNPEAVAKVINGCESKTSLRAKQSLKKFIGQRVEWEGRVVNVDWDNLMVRGDHGEGFVYDLLVDASGSVISVRLETEELFWLDHPDIAYRITRGDRIRFRGKIHSMPWLLRDCVVISGSVRDVVETMNKEDKQS